MADISWPTLSSPNNFCRLWTDDGVLMTVAVTIPCSGVTMCKWYMYFNKLLLKIRTIIVEKKHADGVVLTQVPVTQVILYTRPATYV